MSKYYINYHMGVISEPTDGNLEEAKRFADSGITYTKSDVSIEDEHGDSGLAFPLTPKTTTTEKMPT